MIRHSLLCRLWMAFAARRVCTCGATLPMPRSHRYRVRRWLRQRLRQR